MSVNVLSQVIVERLLIVENHEFLWDFGNCGQKWYDKIKHDFYTTHFEVISIGYITIVAQVTVTYSV